MNKCLVVAENTFNNFIHCRRQSRRHYVLGDLSALIYLPDRSRRSSNVLDLSRFGAYVIFASRTCDALETGHQVSIQFEHDSFTAMPPVWASICHITREVFVDTKVCGLGLSFGKELPKYLFTEDHLSGPTSNVRRP